MSTSSPDVTTAPIDASKVRNELRRIVESPVFAGSPRLVEFLEHVVQEVLAGNGHRIRAKSIGIDLYNYGVDEIEQRVTVVRVDAGRVRKKLEQYYEELGADDPLVIDLPKGGYAPVFRVANEGQGPDREAAGQTAPARRFLLAGAALFIVATVMIAWSLSRDNHPETATRENSQRTAIFEDSPARLRAINLAEQGRDLIFPAVDPGRLASALQVFTYAIEEDPEYFGGYAGAAQVHAMIALLSPRPDRRDEQISLAEQNAERAKHLAPGTPWSLSSQAWLDFVLGNCETALRLSERAARSDPADPHVAEFDALTTLFCDDFERTKHRVATILPHLRGDTGFVFTNALGSVLYHEGNYRGTIEQFEKSIADGGPTGPISLAYLMAAHYRLGETARAGELAQLYEEYFPDQRVDVLMSKLYSNPAYGEDLAEAMAGAGLNER